MASVISHLLSETSDLHIRANLGDKHANTTDVYINGIRHEYRPRAHDAETFAKKINAIAQHNHGRALVFCKANSEFLGSDKPKKEPKEKSMNKPVQLDLFNKESGIGKLMSLGTVSESSDFVPHHKELHEFMKSKGFGNPDVHNGNHDYHHPRGDLVRVYKTIQGKVAADHYVQKDSAYVDQKDGILDHLKRHTKDY